MWNKSLTFLVSLYNFLHGYYYSCPFPEQLHANTVDHQQYLGKWYFRAAISRKEAEIQKFQAMDNMWFIMEETDNNTLLTTGHMRIAGNCVKQTWTYKIHADREDLELEGRPQRRNLLWSGKWINCSHCIIFQEVEPPLSPTDSEDSLDRFMLYTRQNDTNADAVALFLKHGACHNVKANVTLPQQREFCT